MLYVTVSYKSCYEGNKDRQHMQNRTLNHLIESDTVNSEKCREGFIFAKLRKLRKQNPREMAKSQYN